MFGSVTAASQTAYANNTASTRTAPVNEKRTASTQQSDKIDISVPAASLATLPEFSLDPSVHMARAETQLNELMTKLGIPPTTEVNIHMSNSGQFTVEGDHKKLAELEKMLNDGSELELRNSLVGAHTSSIIQRIAAASQATQKQVAANPQSTEMLWNQMLAEADRIKNQSADFRFSSGSLSGASADGTAIAIA